MLKRFGLAILNEVFITKDFPSLRAAFRSFLLGLPYFLINFLIIIFRAFSFTLPFSNQPHFLKPLNL